MSCTDEVSARTGSGKPGISSGFLAGGAERGVQQNSGRGAAPEHRRGHGALYDAVNHGRMDIGRLAGRWPGLVYRAPPMAGWC